MKQATQRRMYCESMFKSAGIEVTFVHGFDGKASQLHHKQDWVSKGLGCFISHFMVLEEIRHNQLGVSVIFEDDIIIAPDFNDIVNKAIADLPKGWDIAAISWFTGDSHADFTPVNPTWNKFTGGDAWGTFAYVVNGSKAACLILEHIMPVNTHIDRALWESCKFGLINGFFIKEKICGHSWQFESQIN